MAPGLGFEYWVETANVAGASSVDIGMIMPRVRVGWRHMLAVSAALDLSLDAGFGKPAQFSNPSNFPFGGNADIPALPQVAARALRKLGADISAARRRRRIHMELMAERALVSRNTIARVERGDPRVSMGIYATVLFVLGMAEKLGEIADVSTDRVGLDIEEERLPKRVRSHGA